MREHELLPVLEKYDVDLAAAKNQILEMV